MQVVFKLKKKCGELTEEELGKVSVQLLNCQSSVEERTIYPCNEQMVRIHMPRSRVGDRGSGPTLEKHKTIGFLSNTVSGPDPQKSQSYQVSIQCWAIISPLAKSHINGVSLAGYNGPFLVVFGKMLSELGPL